MKDTDTESPLDDEEGQGCPVDSRVEAEVSAIIAVLKPRLASHKGRVNSALCIYALGGFALAVLAKRSGIDLVFRGWSGLVAMVVFPAPLLAIILWQIRGEKAVKRRVFQEQGLCCTKCGRSCQGTTDDHEIDWIIARACPHCGGTVRRYANEGEKA